MKRKILGVLTAFAVFILVLGAVVSVILFFWPNYKMNNDLIVNLIFLSIASALAQKTYRKINRKDETISDNNTEESGGKGKKIAKSIKKLIVFNVK